MGSQKVTDLAAGTLSSSSTEAVNGSQLYETNQNLAALDDLAVKYKEGSASRLELNDGDGDTVRISNVADPVDDNDAANKKYVDDKTSDISEDLEGLSDAAVKYDDGSNKTKITLEGEGGTTIANVKAGELSATSTEAVNGSQLYETNQNLASLDGLAVKYDDETKKSISLGDGTDNVTIKNVADGVNPNDAVNKGQLDKGLEDTLASANAKSKWSLKVNDGDPEEIGNGKVVTLKDGTNVSITKDADGNYVFSTVAAPEFDSITIRGTDISINSNGIDMGGTNISNLADGTEDSDAVNLSQLNEVRDLTEANADKLEEHSVYIENHEQEFKTLQTVLGDGYSNPTFNTIKVGNISSDGININMSGGIITGLGDGGIYPGSTDAVTGNQLWNAYKRMDDLNESINIVGAHAAAMSGLHPVPYNPYEPTTLSAAFGTYRDEYAVAVGVFHYVRSNLMFNLGASLCSDGDIMGRAGISISVGPNSKKKPELARDMVTMQQIQLQSQYRIQELEAEIAALKQQITQITSISK